MLNVVKVLKAEIARISRREARSATQGIAKSNTWLRRVVADLRKRVLLLEKEKRRLAATVKKYQVAQPQVPDEEEGKKARFTSSGIRALRKKLRLSQADFGKLLGTTPHAVYLWEKKRGALNLRDRTKAALLSITELTAKDAKQKLSEFGEKRKGGRRAVSRKRKR